MNAVNWSELVATLHATHRMTLIDIAMAIDSHRDSVRNYANRVTTPSHLTGEKLIALWLATTGRPREALPMERVMPSAARMRRG